MSCKVLKAATGPIDARVSLPGSKSLTNRALLAAALADGRSRISEALIADDTERMVAVLRSLGVRVDLEADRRRATVYGVSGHWPESEVELHCGDAGTVARFMTAAVAAGIGTFRIDGSPRMRQRPMGPLIDVLRSLGAIIEPLDEGKPAHQDNLPIRVRARQLAGGRVSIAAADSSQFLSALLLAAPLAMDDVYIEVSGDLVSKPYVAMTLDVMAEFGISAIQDDAGRFIVPAPQQYQASDYKVEPDASAAAIFWAAAAVTGGCVTVEGLQPDSLQGDARFPAVLERMGCKIECPGKSTRVMGPPLGSLRGVDIDLRDMPDVAPPLAVLAAFGNGPTRIRGVGNLRIKESDRLAALSEGLIRLGARAELHADGLTITPGAAMHAAETDSHNDHRIAMSFAIAGLRIPGVTIVNPACVSKTFPGFFDAWEALYDPAKS